MKQKKPTARAVSGRRSRSKTSRPAVHRRVLGHPVTLFFLLITGVLLVASSLHTSAEDYTVHASVRGVAPASPAVIGQPADGAHVTAAQQTVSGTCPTGSYVKVYVNGLFAGVATCSVDGTFDIVAYVLEGVNSLTARVFNSTDDEGPASAAVTVYYDPPATPVSPAPSPTPSPSPSSAPTPDQPKASTGQSITADNPVTTDRAAASAPFWLLSDYRYQTYANGQPVEITISLQGGEPPFALAIDWGDGAVTPVLREDRSPATTSHVYRQATDRQTYLIAITATDAHQTAAHLQLMAVVNGRNTTAPVAVGSGSHTNSNALTHSLEKAKQWLWVAWPAYGTITLMAGSFWLGENEAVQHMLRLRLRHKH